ncbi:hypothetical protein CN527_30735 [Bacillus cereus]|nr:hypothetical protein CN527_30735 [Bacillus cereus]PFA23250.1 hypothetical protein CN390_30400 [Bacillus cereus]PGO03712.1 hypothetical protein CN976_04425 [Bacillus cereus]
MGKVEKQLGNESFTNLDLDKDDEDTIYFIVDGDKLGVLFEANAKPYISTYESGKWTKDKEINVKDIVPGGNFITTGYGSVEVQSGESQVTHAFVNYKGDVVFKDTTDKLQVVDINSTLGANKLQNTITSSSKGNVILHKDSEDKISLISQSDGKEIMKLDGVKDFPRSPGYLDFDKKLMFQNDEIYDFDKKKYVYDSNGQKLDPDKNGKVVASDNGKSYGTLLSLIFRIIDFIPIESNLLR